jgi:hypothetical protein
MWVPQGNNQEPTLPTAENNFNMNTELNTIQFDINIIPGMKVCRRKIADFQTLLPRLIDWLINWLINWLTGRLIDWSVAWSVACYGRSIDWLIVLVIFVFQLPIYDEQSPASRQAYFVEPAPTPALEKKVSEIRTAAQSWWGGSDLEVSFYLTWMLQMSLGIFSPFYFLRKLGNVFGIRTRSEKRIHKVEINFGEFFSAR